MTLQDYGWDSSWRKMFEEEFDIATIPARVTAANRGNYVIVTEEGDMTANLSGRFRHTCDAKAYYPTVGDWVAVKTDEESGVVRIVGLLDRRGAFTRKVAGEASDVQVIAANVHVVFIVSGLDQDHNIRRLERYATLAGESGADYVFVLNKADLRDDVDAVLEEMREAFPHIETYAVSAQEGEGLEQLEKYLGLGKTAVFLGSSGVGKSTIINQLLGEDRIKTQDVRGDDSRGRHTTTSRNLFVLPGGGLVIDTPGLREIQLTGSGEGLSATFADIEEYAAGCKYNHCTHSHEPDCAVKDAVSEGRVSQERLESFQKLRKEIEYNLSRSDPQSKNKRSKRWKHITKQIRHMRNRKGRGEL